MTASSSDPSSSEVTLALPDVPVKTSEKCHHAKPIRLLSLDGGGIRGISSILILKDVMRQVNRNRKDELQPWQVFDLIGGTSTGGIIAIMLGSLRMTLDECHEAYIKLAKTIFKPKRCKFNVFSRGLDFISANERYDSEKFEQVVKAIIARRKGSSSARLHDPADSNCKVFVTTVQADENELVLLRSYHNPQQLDKLSPQLEMWEALRATSAATTYFKEFRRGDTGFVDGAFKSNNPVFQVYHEAKDLWPGRPAFVVSIGTGTKPSVPLRGHALQLARTLTKLVTETEETWNRFNRGNKDMLDANMLFRYSVPEIGCVDLGDHQQLSTVESSTNRWLRSPSAAKYVSACAHKVREIETTDYAKLDQEAREREGRSKSSLSAEEKECLKTLHRAAPDYESQRLTIETPVPGTCEWFLEHPSFIDWLKKPASMLWVTANAGCGKSVLSNHLVGHVKGIYGDGAIVCSFFFKAGESTRRQSDQALCGMLHQLLSNHHDLVRVAMDDFSSKDAEAFTNNVEGLWRCLCAAAKLLKKRLIFIVDALDECIESSRNRLCDLLASSFGRDTILETPPNLKFLVTSRPWPTLESRLRPVLSIRIRGEDEDTALNHDIELMIKHRVGELQNNSSLSPEASALLQRRLMRGADRTFLWASLVLDTVSQMPSRKMSAIRQMLDCVPQGLDQLYASALTKFANPDASLALLETLLVARRALTVDEVNIALSISGHIESVKQLQEDIEPDPEWTIKHLGGFFVRVSHSVVSLVHQTAREFLYKSATEKKHRVDVTSALIRSDQSSPDIHRANLRLATACMRFLLLEGLPSRREGIPSERTAWPLSNETYLSSLPSWLQGFMEYASKSWFLHFEEEALSESVTEMHSLLPKLCDPKTRHFANWWPFYSRSDWVVHMGRFLPEAGDYSEVCSLRGDTFFAHYAAKDKCSAIVRGLVEAGYCRIDEENEADLDLVALAAWTENLKLLKWLLNRTDTNNNQEMVGNAFVIALGIRAQRIVEFLATAGTIDMNATYRAGRKNSLTSRATPIRFLLDIPCSPDRTPNWAMTLLLDHGLDLQDEYIVEAASNGFYGLLKIMIDRDSRPLEKRLYCLQKACVEATRHGWPDCVETVRIYRSDKMAVATDLSCGLHVAATRCDDDAVDKMLHQGAEDTDGDALRSACVIAVEGMVERLLERHQYPRQHLDSALRAYFEMICNPDLKGYQASKLTKSLRSRAPRLFQAFPIISTFGFTENEKTAVLDMLIQRGAKASGRSFVQAFAVVIAMDDDFAVFLLDRLYQLQDDDTLTQWDFLMMACFWGKIAVVKLILESVECPRDCLRRTRSGITPLLAATVSGNNSVVRLLLERGAVVEPATLEQPKRADDVASHAVDVLGAEMASLWSKVIDATDAEYGGHPITFADRFGFHDIKRLLVDHASN